MAALVSSSSGYDRAKSELIPTRDRTLYFFQGLLWNIFERLINKDGFKLRWLNQRKCSKAKKDSLSCKPVFGLMGKFDEDGNKTRHWTITVKKLPQEIGAAKDMIAAIALKKKYNLENFEQIVDKDRKRYEELKIKFLDRESEVQTLEAETNAANYKEWLMLLINQKYVGITEHNKATQSSYKIKDVDAVLKKRAIDKASAGKVLTADQRIERDIAKKKAKLAKKNIKDKAKKDKKKEERAKLAEVERMKHDTF